MKLTRKGMSEADRNHSGGADFNSCRCTRYNSSRYPIGSAGRVFQRSRGLHGWRRSVGTLDSPQIPDSPAVFQESWRGYSGAASTRAFRSRVCFGRTWGLWGLEQVVRLCSAAIIDGRVLGAGITVLKKGCVGDPPGFL